MTLAEFLEWDPGDTSVKHWQLIDGEPVAMAPAREAHGAIQAEVGRLLSNHLIERGLPCRVIVAPGVVPLVRSDRNFRIPDLGVTCAPPSQSVTMAAPVLPIEVLSPGNETETRANIWTFTTLPSVTEILIVDSVRIGAELLRRGPDGSWPDQPALFGSGEDLNLASIGFVGLLDGFYRTTALPVAAAG